MKSTIALFLLAIVELFGPTLMAGDIFSAAHEGNIVDIKNILNVDPELVNSKSECGCTPLLVTARAAKENKAWVTAAILLLLERGSDPNAKCESHNCALEYLVRERCEEAVEAMVQFGAEITASENRPPAMAFCIREDKHMTRRLAALGARLFSSEQEAKLICVVSVVGYSMPEVLSNAVLEKMDSENDLHFLIRTKQHGVLRDVLNLRHNNGTLAAEINSPNQYGHTPLYVAMVMRDQESITMLLNNSADPAASNSACLILSDRIKELHRVNFRHYGDRYWLLLYAHEVLPSEIIFEVVKLIKKLERYTGFVDG